MKTIKVSGRRFIDSKGRHVILNGVNMVYKGKMENGRISYIPRWNERDFRNLREWGFNVIRLGLIWNAVEPEPGVYNEKYLDWAEHMLNLCKENQIYVYLDMHQDLYGVEFGNGAPKWATITDGQPHVEGEKWSDAYIFSGAVKRSFDNFWANTTIEGNKGIQDYYIDMWLHVVKRFSNHSALIGYDFMNEPYPGSLGQSIFQAILTKFAELINKKNNSSMDAKDMLRIFSQESQMMDALEILKDKCIFRELAQAVEHLVEKFDRGDLGKFYNKISQAVRRIDKKSIIMRENSYFSNIGIECKAHPILLENGQRDPEQAFSPHGYDFVVDTKETPYASNNRVDVIFDAHKRTQEKLDIPVLVGEWGAHYHYEDGLSHVEHILSIFDKNLWSNTYWCYVDNFYNVPALDVLKRPYPQAVCGEILEYEYNRRDKVFTMKWDESGHNATSIVYIPTKDFQLDMDGDYDIEHFEDSTIIKILPRGGYRALSITIK